MRVVHSGFGTANCVQVLASLTNVAQHENWAVNIRSSLAVAGLTGKQSGSHGNNDRTNCHERDTPSVPVLTILSFFWRFQPVHAHCRWHRAEVFNDIDTAILETR